MKERTLREEEEEKKRDMNEIDGKGENGVCEGRKDSREKKDGRTG